MFTAYDLDSSRITYTVGNLTDSGFDPIEKGLDTSFQGIRCISNPPNNATYQMSFTASEKN